MSTESKKQLFVINMSQEQFEDINNQLIEHRKALIERDRILSILSTIDKELSIERKNLNRLLKAKKSEKNDVDQLGNSTPKALFYKAIQRYDEQLNSEVEEFIEAKLAAESCRLKIARLESNLIELEEQLVPLAAVDETVTSLQEIQLTMINSLNSTEALQYKDISAKLSETMALHQEFAEASKLGEIVLVNMEHMINLLRSYFKTINSHSRAAAFWGEKPAHEAIKLGFKLQPNLDYYQYLLKKLTGDFQNLSINTPSINLGIGSNIYVTGIYQSQYQQPGFGDISKIDSWFSHLKQIKIEVQSSLKLINLKKEGIHREFAQLKTKKQTLLETLWQASNFPKKRPDSDGMP